MSKIGSVTRRTVGMSLVVAPLLLRGGTALAKSPEITEFQQGDPSLPPETLSYDRELINLLNPTTQATLAPRVKDFAQTILSTSQQYLGFDRQHNQAEIAEMLAVFASPFEDKISHKPVPFCAAGVSYVMLLAYAVSQNENLNENKKHTLRKYLAEVDEYHFLATVSVPDMWRDAEARRRRILYSPENPSTPKAGWLVVFDWSASGQTDKVSHVGIVESFSSNSNLINTIEFNTCLQDEYGKSEGDGGHITRRSRIANGQVKGFINTSIKSLREAKD